MSLAVLVVVYLISLTEFTSLPGLVSDGALVTTTTLPVATYYFDAWPTGTRSEVINNK